MRFFATWLFIGMFVTTGSALAQHVVNAKKVSQAPGVDGVADEIWTSAPATLVPVARIPDAIVSKNKEKQTGKYASNWQKSEYTAVENVEVRALYTDEEIYFLVKWADATRDDQHKPWQWKGDKKNGEYVKGEQLEDRLALAFPIKGEFNANKLINEDSVKDVWHWKAARTNPIGIAHDKSHKTSQLRPTGTSAAHYDADGNEVFISRPDDGGEAPYKSNNVDPFTYKQDQIPSYLPVMPSHEDARDVAAKGVWQDGTWTLEFGRKLDTGHHETDGVFDPKAGSMMSIAVFDHTGDHFHAVSKEVQLVFE